MHPILPTELIFMIFQYTPQSMFLTNKSYTKSYLKPKYKHIYFQKRSTIPIFKHNTRRTVFQYSDWVLRIGLFLEPKKWENSDFQLLELTNCETFDVYLQSSNQEDDYALTFDCAGISDMLPVLVQLNNTFIKYHTIFDHFHWDYLSGLHIVNLEVPFPNTIPNLTHLTLFYANEFDLINKAYPYIHHVRIYEYESRNIDIFQQSFPNLFSLNLCMNDALKCTILPRSLQLLELGFLRNDQQTLPLPISNIDQVVIKIPFPELSADLFKSGLKIKEFSLFIGNQLCLANHRIMNNSYRAFKYPDYNIYLRDMKYAIDTEMIKQLAILIGIQDTLWLTQSFSSRY